MGVRITQTHFDQGTGEQTSETITLPDFNARMGAYAINDVPVTTRWVDAPDGNGATVVTVATRGRVQFMWYVAL